VANITVSREAIFVAFDTTSDDIYALSGGNYATSWGITVIRGSTNAVSATLPLSGAPGSIAFDSNGTAYVTSPGTNAVLVISAATLAPGPALPTNLLVVAAALIVLIFAVVAFKASRRAKGKRADLIPSGLSPTAQP